MSERVHVHGPSCLRGFMFMAVHVSEDSFLWLFLSERIHVHGGSFLRGFIFMALLVREGSCSWLFKTMVVNIFKICFVICSYFTVHSSSLNLLNKTKATIMLVSISPDTW